MANLNTKTISAGVGDILAVDGGIDASTARQIKDGDGTVSPFYITQSSVGVNVSPAETFHLKNTTGGNSECKFVMDGADMAIQIINAMNTWTFGADNAPDRFVIADGTGLSSGEKLVIQADGKVGIGASSPAQELEVAGDIAVLRTDVSATRYVGITQSNGDMLNSTASIGFISDGTDQQISFHTHNSGSSSGERMRIDEDGKVGIGTDTPDALLTVDGNTTSSATVTLARFHSHEDNSEGSILELTGTTHTSVGNRNITLQSYYNTSTASILALNPAGGNVGIGTVTATDPLTIVTSGALGLVLGEQTGTTTESARLFFLSSSSGSANCTIYNKTGYLAFSDNSTEGGGSSGTVRTRFVNGGGISPNANDSYDLGQDGLRWEDVYATNGTINSSDERMKNTILDSTLGLDFVNKLRPVSYKWNATTRVDKDDNDKVMESVEIKRERTHYGLIAQEVKKVLDGLSIDSKDFAGYIDSNQSGNKKSNSENVDVYGLRYTEFIAPLIKAVQELSAKVTALENK